MLIGRQLPEWMEYAVICLQVLVEQWGLLLVCQAFCRALKVSCWLDQAFPVLALMESFAARPQQGFWSRQQGCLELRLFQSPACLESSAALECLDKV